MTPAERLSHALRPERLALIGGSNLRPMLRLLSDSGFAGALAIVNPSRAELDGVPAFPAVEALPFVPDLAFVGVNRNATDEVLRALARAGCPAAIVNAGGYAETGPDGAARQERLLEAAGGMLVIGPNSPGFINRLDGAAVFMDHLGADRVERGVAVVSQGGGFLCDAAFSDRSVPFSHLIGLGNQAQVTVAETIEALLSDTRVSAIGVVLEGLPNTGGFAEAAARAADLGIPLVALKAGRSEAGARASASHTASLTGEAHLWQALFRRQNVMQVDSMAELLELLKLAHVSGTCGGKRLFVGSGSGIQGIVAADLLSAQGFELPPPSAAAATAARALLPDIATPANPQDVTMAVWGRDGDEAAIYRALLQDGHDGALLLTNYPPEGMWDVADFDRSVDAFLAARAGAPGLSAIVSTLDEGLPPAVHARAIAAGVTPLQGAGTAAVVLARLRDWTLARAKVADRGRLLVGPVPQGVERPLSEADAKARLSAAGFPVPRAIRFDRRTPPSTGLRWPVALKCDSPRLAHKTEIGAVVLGIGGAQALSEAVRAMDARLALGAPELADAPFVAEEMVTDALAEIVVAFRREAQMGWVVTFGMGGKTVELFGDVRHLLLPLTAAEVDAGLATLKVDALLRGWRGAPVADRAAVVALIVDLAAWVAAQADLLELEMNPILVCREGAVIVDAFARVADMAEAAETSGSALA